MRTYPIASSAGKRNATEPVGKTSDATAKRRKLAQQAFRQSIQEDANWSRGRVKVPKALAGDKGPLAVYMLVASFGDGRCFPTQKWIADQLGVSERQAREWINLLDKKFWISRTTGWLPPKGWLAGRTVTYYTVKRPRDGVDWFAMLPREWVGKLPQGEKPLSPLAKAVLFAVAFVQGDNRVAWTDRWSENGKRQRFYRIEQKSGLGTGDFYRGLQECIDRGAVEIDQTPQSEPDTDWEYDEHIAEQLLTKKWGRWTIRVCPRRPERRHDVVADTPPIGYAGDTLSAPPAAGRSDDFIPPAAGRSPDKFIPPAAGPIRSVRSTPDSDPEKTVESNSECSASRAPARLLPCASDTRQVKKNDPKPEPARRPSSPPEVIHAAGPATPNFDAAFSDIFGDFFGTKPKPKITKVVVPTPTPTPIIATPITPVTPTRRAGELPLAFQRYDRPVRVRATAADIPMTPEQMRERRAFLIAQCNAMVPDFDYADAPPFDFEADQPSA